MKPSISIRKYREADAAELLRMWKESQTGWPAGMSTASGNSPDEFNHNLMQGIELAHFVAEDTVARRIVGYGGFSGNTVDSRFSELPLLNVHPDWQKCGIGRMLIAAVVNESLAHGFRRVSLGTWPGNMYAVGLYKRCGFCWVPETEIHMVNFMPLIRSTPFLKTFFERNDWYDSYRVEKTPEPDNHLIGKMKVYHYRFESPDRVLNVTIDRHAAAVCGIDTGSERLELFVEDSEGLRGLPRRFTCRIRNTQADILEGAVRFEGRYGLTADGSGTFRLEPGDEWLREFDVDVPCDLETPRHGPKPSIAAVVVLNGSEVTLETGLETELPVECHFHDSDVFLRADQEARKVLNVENRLEIPVSLELAFRPGSGLTVSPASMTVDLPPKAQAGFPLNLKAVPGHHTMTITIADRDRTERALPSIDRELCGTVFGGAGWMETKDLLRVRNGHFTATVNKHSSRITIIDNRHDAGISLSLPDAGPPFPFKSTEADPVFSCTGDNGRVVLVVTSDSSVFRGITRNLTLTIGESPLIRISGQITSRDSAMKIPRIRQAVTAGFRHSETVIPTREGIISHSDASFPFGPQDLPHDPAFYPEKWCMLRYRRNIAGFIWTGTPDDIRFADWKIATLNYHDTAIDPEHPWILPENYVWLGPGDELTMQNLWSEFSGDKPELHVQPLIGFDREIVPLIVHGPRKIRLQLRNRREFAESGSLIMDANPEAGIRRRTVPVCGLTSETTTSISLTVHPRVDHPTASELRTAFRGEAFDLTERVPMILFPDSEQAARVEKIRQHDFDIFRIRNGVLSMDVVPSFHGVLTAFNYKGNQLLRSPFPETGVLGFESQWFGGITPEMRLIDHEKVDLKWTGSRIAVRDGRGDKWVGVRLKSGIVPDEKKHRFRVTMDYLTLPGCPLLGARLLVRNVGTTVAHPVVVLVVFPGLDGEPFDHTGFRKFGTTTTRHRSGRRGIFPFENWIGFAPAERTGPAKRKSVSESDACPSLALVQGHPFRTMSPLLIDVGKDGSYIVAYESRKLDPGEEFHIMYFLVPFIGDAMQASGFESLGNVTFG